MIRTLLQTPFFQTALLLGFIFVKQQASARDLLLSKNIYGASASLKLPGYPFNANRVVDSWVKTTESNSCNQVNTVSVYPNPFTYEILFGFNAISEGKILNNQEMIVATQYCDVRHGKNRIHIE